MTRKILLIVALCLLGLLGALLVLSLRPQAPAMPRLVLDLPADETAAGVEFQRRLRERFPDHSAEGDLVTELNAQGFDTWPQAGLAHFTWPAPPCTESWQVLWSAESGRLINVSGRRARVCQ